MAFPQTRHTLIQRLATGGSQDDWRDFLSDYWGPVCRFALRRGNGRLADAEDAAANTFEIVLRNELLQRWIKSQRAKLRTLLCGVVCKVQANQIRSDQRKQLFEQAFAEELFASEGNVANEQQDELFTGAWVEDLLQTTLQRLAKEYHSQGKGDYFRVLHGRLCGRLSIDEVAQLLKISPSAVNNYHRHVRKRLSESLETAVRTQVARYCKAENADAEFHNEWTNLAAYLADHGGLEEAVRRTHDLVEANELQTNKPRRIQATLTRISLSPTNK